jgi:glycosyltransferase involved in cell wall biosynthesis
MRIAYICADPGVPVFGHKGCSIHVQEVIRALAPYGAQIDLFATRFDGDRPADLALRHIHRLPALPKGDIATRERTARAINGDLKAALEQAGPFDVVYERYSLWSFAGMEYARAIGAAGLLEVNAPLIDEQAHHRGLADRAGAERVAQQVFAAASALLAVSAEVAAYLERYPATRGRVHVVPNGVNPDRFPADLAGARTDSVGPFTVGFVGSLKPWHGLPVLVRAFAELHQRDPNSRLLLVGDGPERATIAAELVAANLSDTARFTGAVAPTSVPELLGCMDVAVAPYPQDSSFYFSPLKVYEYMAAGRAVVASRVGQLATLIQDGVNGLLCPPGDPAALAGALDRLRRQPALRARLACTGRTAVLRDHTWDAVARRILNLARHDQLHEQSGR